MILYPAIDILDGRAVRLVEGRFEDATTYHAGEAACATDGAACTPDPQAMRPMTQQGASCCAPQPGCC